MSKQEMINAATANQKETTMKTRNYYAASNAYGSETSAGFANAWQVHVFSSREDRDAWVDGRGDMATRAIKRSEIAYYLSEVDDTPAPYTGEYRAIVWSPETDQVAGHIGRIQTVPGGMGFESLWGGTV